MNHKVEFESENYKVKNRKQDLITLYFNPNVLAMYFILKTLQSLAHKCLYKYFFNYIYT